MTLTPHPVLLLPTEAEIAGFMSTPEGRERLAQIIEKRETIIQLSQENPLEYGFRNPSWEVVAAALKGNTDEALLMGGNRSAKSEFAAWFAMSDLCYNPNKEWAFFHSSHDSSIRQQQSRCYRYMLPAWRSLRKQGQTTNICYTEKTGFTFQVFILPNGSKGYYFNYGQKLDVLEGYEWDGVWSDELIPIDFLETIRYRLVNRHGKLLLTFTPVTGYTQTVAEYMAGSEVIKTEVAPLIDQRKVHVPGCPPGHMPRECVCVNRYRRVFFFFTSDNPFNPYQVMVRKLEGKPETEVKMRAYGWPTKRMGNLFAKFTRKVHVVPMTRVPRNATRYRAIDPGNAKNWFIKWYAVDSLGRVYVYREWPDMDNYGEWALPSSQNPDGKHGPAQTAEGGHSIADYKQLMLRAEGWRFDEVTGAWDGSKTEYIAGSVIDPRMAGATQATEDGTGTSILDMLLREQVNAKGHVVGPPMDFTAGAGGSVADGLQLLVDKMDYDQREPVSITNTPHWFVVDTCRQSIYAYQEYTGAGGEKGAMKDVIDPDRYFVKTDWGYILATDEITKGGGSY